jgi:hypothetical protein
MPSTRVASASSDTGSTGGGTDSGAGGGGADNSALISAITDLKASIDAQTAFATSVSNTSNFQLTKYLSDRVLRAHRRLRRRRSRVHPGHRR